MSTEQGWIQRHPDGTWPQYPVNGDVDDSGNVWVQQNNGRVLATEWSGEWRFPQNWSPGNEFSVFAWQPKPKAIRPEPCTQWKYKQVSGEEYAKLVEAARRTIAAARAMGAIPYMVNSKAHSLLQTLFNESSDLEKLLPSATPRDKQ